MDKSDLNWGIRAVIDSVIPKIKEMEETYEYLDFVNMGASFPLDTTQSLQLISTKIRQLNSWLKHTNHIITVELIEAWNLEDSEDKESKIQKVSNKIIASSKGLIEWERSVAMMIPTAQTRPIFELMRGLTLSLQADLCTLFNDIKFVLDHDGIHGEMEIKSPFKHPAKLYKVSTMLKEFSVNVERPNKASFINSIRKD